MPSVPFLQYDVFTSRPFEGNQLAVFPDARGLEPRDMQTLASEMNFSESTFVLPAEDTGTDVRMRIFTPGREMPMAGHPTVGTTFALADLGVIPAQQRHWVFGLNVGPTPVALAWEGPRLASAWMNQGRPQFRPPVVDAADVLASIHADPAAWTATDLPVEEGSCGNAFFFVALATREAVDACAPDGALMHRLVSAFPGAPIGVFVFSAEPMGDGATVYSRMFAPEAGVIEDPATGSATGPLGGYLVRHGVVPLDQADQILSLQGVRMGRPSRLHVKVDATSRDDITGVHVGGSAVKVGEGKIEW